MKFIKILGLVSLFVFLSLDALAQCNWYGTVYPLCTNTSSGWGWENNQSCISPSTCEAERGASIVDGSTDNNTSQTGSCNWYGATYPLCTIATSGWGWENNQNCISRSACESESGASVLDGTSTDNGDDDTDDGSGVSENRARIEYLLNRYFAGMVTMEQLEAAAAEQGINIDEFDIDAWAASKGFNDLDNLNQQEAMEVALTLMNEFSNGGTVTPPADNGEDDTDTPTDDGSGLSENRARIEYLLNRYFAGMVTMEQLEAAAAEQGINIDEFDIDAWAASKGFNDLDNLSQQEAMEVALTLMNEFSNGGTVTPPADNGEDDTDTPTDDGEDDTDTPTDDSSGVSENRERIEYLLNRYFAGMVTMEQLETAAAEQGINIDEFDIDAWAAGKGFNDLDNLSQQEAMEVALTLMNEFSNGGTVTPPADDGEDDTDTPADDGEDDTDTPTDDGSGVSENRARIEYLLNRYFAGMVTMEQLEAAAAEQGINIDEFDIDAWAASKGFSDLDNMSQAEAMEVALALMNEFSSGGTVNPPVDNGEDDTNTPVDNGEDDTDPPTDDGEDNTDDDSGVSGNRARIEYLLNRYFAGMVTMADVEAAAAEQGINIDEFDIDAWAAGKGFNDLDNMSQAEAMRLALALMNEFGLL